MNVFALEGLSQIIGCFKDKLCVDDVALPKFTLLAVQRLHLQFVFKSFSNKNCVRNQYPDIHNYIVEISILYVVKQLFKNSFIKTNWRLKLGKSHLHLHSTADEEKDLDMVIISI
jgi:hypothetical protein